MDATTVLALVLALVSTTLINLAYLREHEAAAAMPALSLRRPIQSVVLLFSDRSWLTGFAMESGGFILYAVALALASLALVQSISAGGIGVLAFVSARMAARPLTRRELSGVLIAVVGLVALAVSLAGGSDESGDGALVPIVLWLGGTAAAAGVVLTAGRRIVGGAGGHGGGGGPLFSVGGISTTGGPQG